MTILTVIFSTLAILISLPAIILSVYTCIEIKAFQRSTHKVQFMPVPEPDAETMESLKEKKRFMESFQPDMTDDFIV